MDVKKDTRQAANDLFLNARDGTCQGKANDNMHIVVIMQKQEEEEEKLDKS